MIGIDRSLAMLVVRRRGLSRCSLPPFSLFASRFSTSLGREEESVNRSDGMAKSDDVRMASFVRPGAAGGGTKDFFPVTMTEKPSEGKVVVETLGLVTSTSVMSRNILVDIYVAIMGMFGGPMPPYEEMVADAVVRATDGVATAAQKLGADEVINFRIEKAVVTNRLIFGIYSFCTAYGTAVRTAPKTGEHEL